MTYDIPVQLTVASLAASQGVLIEVSKSGLTRKEMLHVTVLRGNFSLHEGRIVQRNCRQKFDVKSGRLVRFVIGQGNVSEELICTYDGTIGEDLYQMRGHGTITYPQKRRPLLAI